MLKLTNASVDKENDEDDFKIKTQSFLCIYLELRKNFTFGSVIILRNSNHTKANM